MLQLKRGIVNKLTSNLRDTEIGGSGSDYLIEFKTMNSTSIFVIPVVLSDTDRATQFTLELIPDGDSEQGQIELRHGHWDVKVYRQDSATNLDPEDSSVDGLVFETQAFVERGEGDEKPIFYKVTIPDAIYYESRAAQG